MTDAEALDQIAEFLNRPGQWNGGDVCEFVAETITATGRELVNVAEHEDVSLPDEDDLGDFVRLCRCGQEFYGATGDEADAALLDHLADAS
jgi:hypothetical protein